MTASAYKTNTLTTSDLFHQHAHLVSKIAGNLYRKYPGNDQIDDLKQYGYLGLLESIKRYNPSYGIKFETYATIRIQGAILDAKRKEDWVPRSTRARIKKLKYITEELRAKLGREPTVQELAQEMNMSVDAFVKMSTRLDDRKPLRLDQEDDDSNSLVDTLASGTLSPEELTRRSLLYTELSRNCQRLPEREQKIIKWYYYEGKSFKEIAMGLDLTESRISQIHTKICKKLRKSLS